MLPVTEDRSPEGEEFLVCEECRKNAPEEGYPICTFCALNSADGFEPDEREED